MTLAARTLGEICDEVGGVIRTGPFGSQLHESDYREEGTPVIMPKDIVEGKVSADSIARIGDEDVARLSQHVLKRGEIVYGRRGDIGRRALITEREAGWLCGTGCLRVSLGETVLDPQFLFYYLGQPRVIEAIAKQAVGATLPNLNTSIIRSIPITYPPLPTQRRIASILSAYDDLIENNTRRIKILEQMAQAIYREWFVEFRAPGVKLRKATSEEQKATGKDRFPMGRELKRVGDVIETVGGGTPSTKNQEYWEDGDITWYIPSDLTANKAMFIRDSSKKITRLGFENSSARMFPAYSVMMTSRATIGVIAINTSEACTNQGFITCIPNDYLSAYHIYFWIEQNRERIINIASGATYKEINRSEFRDILIIVPDAVVEALFVEMVGPIGRQIETLHSKNANLRQTRDLLLPRLISGDVDVENLDIGIY